MSGIACRARSSHRMQGQTREPVVKLHTDLCSMCALLLKYLIIWLSGVAIIRCVDFTLWLLEECVEGCSCDLVCMAGLGNMAGSNEGVCCSRAGNVGLYQGVRPTVAPQPVSQQLKQNASYVNVVKMLRH